MSERWSWNYDCCDMLWHAVTNNGRKWQKHHFPRLSLLRWPHREFEAARDHRTTWQCLGSSLLEKWCVLTKSPDCGETVTKVQVLQWCLMLGQIEETGDFSFLAVFPPISSARIQHWAPTLHGNQESLKRTSPQHNRVCTTPSWRVAKWSFLKLERP